MIAILLVAAAGRLVELGPDKAQRDSSAAELTFPFIARADEALTFATVRLAFDARIPGAVEVLVNDERISLLDPAEGTRELPVARALLADRNQLTLRLRDPGGHCVAHAGAWRSLRSAGVVLQAEPVPLPDDLALLPLPFYDRGYDAQATVPLVFAHPPSLSETRLGALTAAWFAAAAPIPISFEAHAGTLPDSAAVVLLEGKGDAARLGLPAPDSAQVRMIDHPSHPGSNRKLLVIAGRDEGELRTAVESLAARTQPLTGALVRLSPAPPQPKAAPWSAPRWIASDRPVPFSRYPERQVLSHDGSTPGTLSVRFRVAPDLFIWPADSVALDLGWSEKLPPGSTPPRLDVEINGYFLATLPPQGRRARLRIPREHMRGFNQLFVYVHYPDEDPCAAAAPRGDPPSVTIDGASVLHVEGLQHYASLPDVTAFAFDGFPFTRVPDLGDTAVVLPERPAESELSMALSIFGQLAQITGRAGTRAEFSAQPMPDKDLLVIGTPPRGWAALLPLEGGQVHAREPWLDYLGGVGPLLDARRAASVLQGSREWAAIEAIESPLTAGRGAVVVTGAQLPPFRDFLGYAQSTGGNADLLLVSDGRRYAFRTGARYGAGRLDPWTRLRWFFATHWIALLPLVFAGMGILAWLLRRGFSRQMRARLAIGAAALLAGAAVRAAPLCPPSAWPHLQRYVERFVSQDGRVLDAGRTTSEGQAYALFFALVADDRALFARLLRWTANNLAQGKLDQRLPAWSWGERRDGSYGVLDDNSASDADLWIAYSLLEAGRLWSEPHYANLARSLLANIAAREVADLPGLGPMLLPGAHGFVTPRGVRLNPSYQPPQLLKRFAAANASGPWAAVLRSSRRMLAVLGPAAPDWIFYDPHRGFSTDPVSGTTGSYDAVRVYLWLGMEPSTDGPRALLQDLSALPEQIDARTLRTRGAAPIGFYGALLPDALSDPRARELVLRRLDGSLHDGLYGDSPAYYDQNLILFGRGFSEGRFRFAADGSLAPAWERQCLGRSR